jgi:biotin carboxylase
MVPSLLLLDTAGSDALALTRAAHEAGYRLFAADGLHANNNRRTLQIPRLLAGSISVDFTRPQAVAALTEYIDQIGISGVLTTNEYLTPLVAQLCARTGLPGNDASVAHTARNKTVMNTALHRHGLCLPRIDRAASPRCDHGHRYPQRCRSYRVNCESKSRTRDY